MPEAFQLLDLSVHLARLFVFVKYSCGFSVAALSYDIDKFNSAAGAESNCGLKSSAGVGVVVEHVVAASAFNSDRVSHCTVGTDKVVKIAAVAANVRAHHAEEPFSVVGAVRPFAAVFVYVLKYLVLLKGGSCNELSVLEVYLILLVVVVVCKLAEAVNGKLSWLAVKVGDHSSPDLVRLALGNIIGNLGFNVCVFRGNNGVSRTVAAFALILVQRLAHRLP